MLLRKFLKILSVFILILLLFVIIVLLTINLPPARKQLVKIINKNLSQKNIPIQLGALNAIKFSQINVSDILIYGEKNDTILFAGNLDVHYALRTLLHNKITILSVDARDLVLRLFQDGSEQPLNLVHAFSKEQDTLDEPADDSTLWTFDIRKILLTSLDLRYENNQQKMHANLSLKQAEVQIKKMDLASKELIVPLIQLNEINSELFTVVDTAENPDTTASFRFPWTIEVANISIQNSSFKLGRYPESPLGLTAPEVAVTEFDSELSDIIFSTDQLGVKIIQTTFNLNNGFKLKELHGELDSRQTKTIFELNVLTNESELHLNGNSDTILLGIDGKSNQSVLSINDSRIALSDLLYFKPELSNAGWFKQYGMTPIAIDAKVFLNEEITSIDSLSLFQSKDLWFSLKGSISDALERAMTKNVDLKVISSIGVISLDGDINLAKESIKAIVQMNNIRPGEISKQNVLNEFNGSIVADVNGFSIARQYSDIKMNLYSVNINDHIYDKIIINGNISPQHFLISTNVNDTAVNLGLNTTVVLNKSNLSILKEGNISIIPAEFGFKSDSLTVDGRISGSYSQAGDSLSSAVELSEILLNKSRDKSRISSLQLNMKSDASQTAITGKSDFMDLDFKMEGPVNNTGILIKELSGYFAALASNFTLDSSFHTFDVPVANFYAQFRYHPVLNFLTNDTSLRFSNAAVHISSNEQIGMIKSNIQLTGIHMGNLSVMNFQTLLMDSAGKINLTTTADSISVSSQFFAGIEFSHQADDSSHQGHTVLAIRKDQDQLNSEIEINSFLDDSLLIVTIPSGQLMLNETIWRTSSPELFNYNLGRGEFLPEVTLYTDSSALKLVTMKES